MHNTLEACRHCLRGVVLSDLEGVRVCVNCGHPPLVAQALPPCDKARGPRSRWDRTPAGAAPDPRGVNRSARRTLALDGQRRAVMRSLPERSGAP